MTHASTRRPAGQASESERNAYNASFYELGLRWHWDADTFEALQVLPNPCDRIRRYIESDHPHLVRAYDPAFLAQAIEARKGAFQKSAQDCGTSSAPYFNWGATQEAELGF
ncbi:MAG: hypothetical protein ABI156_15460 [Caldimonas sp.]